MASAANETAPRASIYAARMFLRRVLFRGILVSVTLLGQTSPDRFDARYDALKQALGLSDAQLLQLQQAPPATARPVVSGNQPLVSIYPGPAAGRIYLSARNQAALRLLDDSQKSKIEAIQKTLGRWDAAAVSIGLGFIDEKEWPGSSACFHYPLRSFASYAYALELGLTSAQMDQFEQIQQAASEPFWAQVREKTAQRSELLNSGLRMDSPAVVQLGAEIDKLQAQTNSRRRDLALAVLDEAQRTKLAEFETALQIANEAIELGLIPKPPVGEPLCH